MLCLFSALSCEVGAVQISTISIVIAAFSMGGKTYTITFFRRFPPFRSLFTSWQNTNLHKIIAVQDSIAKEFSSETYARIKSLFAATKQSKFCELCSLPTYKKYIQLSLINFENKLNKMKNVSNTGSTSNLTVYGINDGSYFLFLFFKGGGGEKKKRKWGW